jgi:hypothetical protein
MSGHSPAEPPAGADPLVWKLALELRAEHSTTDVDGFCATCGEFAPCELMKVAEQGLVLAVQRHAFVPAINADCPGDGHCDVVRPCRDSAS